LLELPFPSHRVDTTFQFKNGAMGYNYFDVITRLDLKGTEKILDVASGACWTSYHFASKGCQVVATDQCTIKYWGLRSILSYTKKVGEKLQGVCCDFDPLPFKDNYFDIIFMNNSFQYVKNVSQFLKEIKRIVTKNGKFVLSWTGSRGLLKSNKWGPGHLISKNVNAAKKKGFVIESLFIPSSLFVSLMDDRNPHFVLSKIGRFLSPIWNNSSNIRFIFNKFFHMPVSVFIGLPFNLIASVCDSTREKR